MLDGLNLHWMLYAAVALLLRTVFRHVDFDPLLPAALRKKPNGLRVVKSSAEKAAAEKNKLKSSEALVDSFRFATHPKAS